MSSDDPAGSTPSTGDAADPTLGVPDVTASTGVAAAAPEVESEGVGPLDVTSAGQGADTPTSEAQPAQRRRRRQRKPKGARALLEWVIVIAVALLVALGIRQFLFQPFWIPTGSMEDTLVAGDRVLVNKAAYRFHDIRRGDVVVFKRPDNWAVEEAVKDLIKRVIGIPGDTITITDCSVYIDGRRLVEPYVDDRCTEPASEVVDPDGDGTFVVPDGVVFVMGDNRTGSSDSRVNGFVPEDDVVGRAFVLIWPLSNWRWL